MKIPLRWALLALSLAGCASAPAERAARIEQSLLPATLIAGAPLPAMPIAARMEHYDIPGASIAVINGGRIEWAKGYGVREHGSNDPSAPDTLFQAGSMSKVVSAVAALRLVQEGALALDEDVNERLTTWRIPENEFTATEKVTLRRLLTHTAGLTPTSSGEYAAGDPIPTMLQILDGLAPAKTPPIRVGEVPGSRYLYSGSGFIVLQQLLTDVAKDPFPQLLQRLVLDPAGMRSSTFEQPLPARLAALAASGHYPGTTVVKGRWETKPELAAAGLWTTATDLARFAIAMRNAQSGRSSRLLPRALAIEMLTPQGTQVTGGADVVHDARGLGVDVRRTPSFLRFGHGGRTTGYVGQFVMFDDGRGAVVLTNGYAQGFVREVIRAIAREYEWPDLQPVTKRVVAVPPELLAQYVGRYEFPEGRRPRISLVEIRDGVLHIDELPLHPESESEFFGTGEATWTFVRGSDGVFAAMVYDIGSMQLTARRLE